MESDNNQSIKSAALNIALILNNSDLMPGEQMLALSVSKNMLKNAHEFVDTLEKICAV